jgi:hypothetical protein
MSGSFELHQLNAWGRGSLFEDNKEQQSLFYVRKNAAAHDE